MPHYYISFSEGGWYGILKLHFKLENREQISMLYNNTHDQYTQRMHLPVSFIQQGIQSLLQRTHWLSFAFVNIHFNLTALHDMHLELLGVLSMSRIDGGNMHWAIPAA